MNLVAPTAFRPMPALDRRLLDKQLATRRYLALTTAIGVAEVATTIAFAILLARLIAQAFTSHALDQQLLLAAIVVGMTRGAMVFGRAAVGRRAADTVLAQLRQSVIARRLRIRRVWEDDPSVLASTLVDGIEPLETYYARYLPQLVLSVIAPIGILVAAGIVDPITAGIMLLTLPVVPVFMVLIGMYTRDATQARQREYELLVGHFADLVSGIFTLRTYDRLAAQREGIERVGEALRRATNRTLRVSFLSGTVLELAATLATALIAVSVGVRLATGHMDLIPGLTMLLLAPELYIPLRAVGTHYHASSEGTAAAERALDALDSSVPLTTGDHLRLIGGDDPAACIFDHVHIGYGGAPDVIDDVTCVVPRGGVTVVSGPSGCGKSTLLASALGLLVPRSGTVYVDASVAWVPQSPTLLGGTLADNVRAGGGHSGSIPDAVVWEALDRAGLASLVRTLPQQLEEPVGDGGRQLSMGERRRLALARAIVSGARLIVLDEPTADLDPRNAALIRTLLRQLSERATVLVATHDEQLMRAADTHIDLAGNERAAASRIAWTTTPISGESLDGGDRTLIDDGTSAVVELPRNGTPRLPVTLGVLAQLAGVLLMGCAGWLMLRASQRPDVLALTVAMVLVRAAGISRPLLRYAERLTLHDAVLRQAVQLRASAFDALARRITARSASPSRMTGLLDVVVQDVESVADMQTRVVHPRRVAVIASALTVLALVWALPLAAAVLAGALLVSLLAIPSFVDRRARRVGLARTRARSALFAQVQEVLAQAPEIAVVGAAGRRSRTLPALEAATRVAGRAASVWEGALDGAVTVIAAATTVIVVALGAHAAGTGQIEPVVIGLIALAALTSFDVASPLGQSGRVRAAAEPAAVRLARLTASSVSAPPCAAVARRVRDEVASVSLVGAQVAFGAVQVPAVPADITVRRGEVTVLTGPSGVGKTIAALTLAGQLTPDRGSRYIADDGGRAVRIADDQIPQLFTIVSQNDYLFHATILDNLRLGDPNATPEMCHDVLARVELTGWLAGLRNGLLTVLERDGQQMSGGQRQRLLLARGLLRNTPFLILDEVTAHLDAQTAHGVIGTALDEAIAQHQGVLLITHRAEGIDRASRSVRLEAALGESAARRRIAV